MIRSRSLVALLIAVTAVLTACGGGGGSGSSSPPPAQQVAAPTITAQPQDASAITGQGTTFSVVASGTGPLAYQWTRNGAAIAGATGSSYTVPASLPEDSGAVYSVTVTNAGGAVTSRPAVLTVLPIPTVATSTLAPGVRLLSEVDEASIAQDRPGRVTFNRLITLGVGDVVIGTGTVFKVTGVTQSGGQTIVTTAQPALEEMFESLVLQGTYAATPEMATAQQATDNPSGRAKRLSAQPQDSVSVSETLNWNFTLSDGGVRIGANLSSAIQATVDYRFTRADGLTRASLNLTKNDRLDLSASYASSSTSAYEKRLGTVVIPIRVTVLDTALTAVGVRVVSLQVPVYAGMTVNSSLQLMKSASAAVSGSIDLGYDTTRGPIAGSRFTGSVSADALNPTTPAGAPALATYTAAAGVYIRAEPALSFLNRVALLGVNTRLGVDDQATVQVVAGSPAYCATNKLDLNLEAHGFVTLAGGRTGRTPSYNRQLASAAPAYLGNCTAPVDVVAQVTGVQPAAYGAPITVQAQVALGSTAQGRPSAAPSGEVTISAANARCSATLTPSTETTAVASCSLTPTASGPAVPLNVSYTGDSRYAPGVGSTTVAIADAALTMTGQPVEVTLDYPFLGNAATIPVTATVGPGVEISSSNLITTVGLQVIGASLDVGGDSIVLAYNTNARAITSSFNGYVLKFPVDGPTILAAQLTADSGSGATVSHTAHAVQINLSGVVVVPGLRYTVKLTLGPPVGR